MTDILNNTLLKLHYIQGIEVHWDFRANYVSENMTMGKTKQKIAKHTTGAKGCNFLAGFLQVSHMFLKNTPKGP